MALGMNLIRVVFGNCCLPHWRDKAEVGRIRSLFFVALIKREVKATFNRMLKVPGLPLPTEDALELRKDCPPGCQHCAPFPSQIINEIKVHGVHFLACPNFLFIFHLGGGFLGGVCLFVCF